MRLRKRQSLTVTYERSGRVVITSSQSREVVELAPGDQHVIDVTLDLTPFETGWEVLP